MPSTGVVNAAEFADTSESMKALFDDQGYVAPISVFTWRECVRILARLQLGQVSPEWDKGWAATSRDYYEVASDERIVDAVASVLGADVVVWGASLVSRKPGDDHPWHCDIESATPTSRTATVWIPLLHGGPRSSLDLMPFSHRFGASVQQLSQQERRARGELSDTEAEAWAKRLDPRSAPVNLGLRPGEGVVFDGRLWHRSHNSDRLRTRYALLLQFAAAETPIRIPSFEGPPWPFSFHADPLPACVVVHGRAQPTPNRIIPAPRAEERHAMKPLRSRVDPIPPILPPPSGWMSVDVFRGSTNEVEDLACHVSVLGSSHSPHEPHAHPEEEVLIVVDGEVDLVWADAPGPGSNQRRQRARRGDLVYYPAGNAHTLANASDAPVRYVVLKWRSDPKRARATLPRFVATTDSAAAGVDHGGFCYTTMFDIETGALKKLHAHLTVAEPGAEYPVHADAHDVAIVLLEGTVETLGREIVAPSVVLYPAGELHGMRNVGAERARYLVLELRGRHLGFRRQDATLFLERVMGLARDPRRLARGLMRRAARTIDHVLRR